MANTINGAGASNVNAYRTPPATKPKNSENEKDKKTEEVKPGSYNDPDRKLEGVFTERQLEFLEKLKDDPENKRLKDNQAMGKDQFMHILLRQLSNQNPLNPMEDKDFIAQMAQFSTLEGMQNMGKSFEGAAKDIKGIKELLGSSRSSDAAILKIEAMLVKIAKKLGIEDIEEKGKEEKEEKVPENTENKEENQVQYAGNKEDKQSASAESVESKKEVNKDIAKKKAEEAYRV